MIHTLIKNLLSDVKNPIIFEIGARQGEDTLIFNKNFPKAEIHAFEPLPSNFRILFDLWSIEDLDSRVSINNIAISDKDGEADFWVSSDPANFNGSSSLKEPKEHLNAFTHVKFEEKIKVQTFKLDTYCQMAKVDHVDFIWADTQGAEVEVIKGGQKTLSKTRYLYMEYYNCPMYEGQVTWTAWAKSLPSKWELIHDFGNDVLLKNMDFQD